MLKIDKFYIQKFRNITKAIIPVADLNVLIGKNGAGKSSVLDALETLSSNVGIRHFAISEGIEKYKEINFNEQSPFTCGLLVNKILRSKLIQKNQKYREKIHETCVKCFKRLID